MKQWHYTISSGGSLGDQLVLKLIVLVHQNPLSLIDAIPLYYLPHQPPETCPYHSFAPQQPQHDFIEVSLHDGGVDWLTLQDHAQQAQHYFQVGCSMTQLQDQLAQGLGLYRIRNQAQRESLQQLDALCDFEEIKGLIVDLEVFLIRQSRADTLQLSTFLDGCAVNFPFSGVRWQIDHNMSDKETEQTCEFVACSQHDSSSIFKMECMAALFLPICLYVVLHIYDMSLVASSRLPYYFFTIPQASLANDQVLVTTSLFDLRDRNRVVQHSSAPYVHLANPNQFYYSSRLDIDTIADCSILYGAGFFLFLLVIGVLIDHAKGESFGDVPESCTECSPKVRQGLMPTPGPFTFARFSLIFGLIMMFFAVLLSEIVGVRIQPHELYGPYIAELAIADYSGQYILPEYQAALNSSLNQELNVIYSSFPYLTLPAQLNGSNVGVQLSSNVFIQQALNASQNETMVVGLNYLADNYNCFLFQNYVGYSNFYAGAFGNDIYPQGNTHRCGAILKSIDASHIDRLQYKIGILLIVPLLVAIAFFFQCKCCRPQEESPLQANLFRVLEATVMYMGRNDLLGLSQQ